LVQLGSPISEKNGTDFVLPWKARAVKNHVLKFDTPVPYVSAEAAKWLISTYREIQDGSQILNDYFAITQPRIVRLR